MAGPNGTLYIPTYQMDAAHHRMVMVIPFVNGTAQLEPAHIRIIEYPYLSDSVSYDGGYMWASEGNTNYRTVLKTNTTTGKFGYVDVVDNVSVTAASDTAVYAGSSEHPLLMQVQTDNTVNNQFKTFETDGIPTGKVSGVFYAGATVFVVVTNTSVSPNTYELFALNASDGNRQGFLVDEVSHDSISCSGPSLTGYYDGTEGKLCVYSESGGQLFSYSSSTTGQQTRVTLTQGNTVSLSYVDPVYSLDGEYLIAASGSSYKKVNATGALNEQSYSPAGGENIVKITASDDHVFALTGPTSADGQNYNIEMLALSDITNSSTASPTTIRIVGQPGAMLWTNDTFGVALSEEEATRRQFAEAG